MGKVCVCVSDTFDILLAEALGLTVLSGYQWTWSYWVTLDSIDGWPLPGKKG